MKAAHIKQISPINPLLDNDARLNNLDATISSRSDFDNSTDEVIVLEINSDKTIGALFEENQTVVSLPEINVTVTTNATHMFSVFE